MYKQPETKGKDGHETDIFVWHCDQYHLNFMLTEQAVEF